MKKLTLLIITLFVNLSVFAGGPWTLKKNSSYLNAGYFSMAFNAIYNDKNLPINLTRRVFDRTLGFYGEYGLTDKLTLTGVLPIKITHTGNLTESITPFTDTLSEGSLVGLGNIILGGRYNFINKIVLVSSSFFIEGNTGRYDDNTGLRTGYDTWAFVPTIHIGGGIGNFAFIYAEAGFGLRTNDYSNDYRIGGEAGIKPTDNSFISLVLDVRQSIGNGTFYESNNLHTGLYMNDVEYVAFGLKAGYEFSISSCTKAPVIGFNAGLYGGTSGNLIGRSAVINFGMYLKFNDSNRNIKPVVQIKSE